jgi:hypothetical protein
VTDRQRVFAARASLAVAAFGFNPGQKRGPDGRFIKMGGPGSAGGKRGSKGNTAPAVTDTPTPPAPAQRPAAKTPKTRLETLEENARTMYGGDESKWPARAKRDIAKIRADSAASSTPAVPTSTPAAGVQPPVGFTPHTDAEWNQMQKRLGKRTPRLDPDGDLQPGDIVPTKDGKWQEVLRPDTSKFWERNGLQGWMVRDDAKGYVHAESGADAKKRIEAYAAERAWREAGGSKDKLDGVDTAPVADGGRRPGEPPIGEDGKYAKPVKQYAVWNGKVSTRSSRNPYRYASVVASRVPGEEGREGIWSWHRTHAGAARGTLTGVQRRQLYVKAVVETGFEEPKTGA